MKRTRILPNRFRKRGASAPLPLLGLVAGAAMLTGCSDREMSKVYYSVDDCSNENPGAESLCNAAYEEALEDAARTAPKYSALTDCEQDFGEANCDYTPREYAGVGRYMPMMAGFMMADALFDIDYKKKRKKNSLALFTSYNRSSPFYGRRVDATGNDFGRVSDRRMRVSGDVYNRELRPASRAMRRGGFGRTVAASRSASRGG